MTTIKITSSIFGYLGTFQVSSIEAARAANADRGDITIEVVN